MQLHELTLRQLQEKLRNKEVSAEETVKDVLAEISRADNKIHAYLSLDEEYALRQAREADRLIGQGILEKEGDKFPLLGIPLALKDLICTEDFKTTCASRMLKDYQSPYDATVVKRLRRAGALFLGKLNLDEFAMGSSTENSAFGFTRNPCRLDRVPGGSSGGSAAAVAADLCAASLGSDTGGSVRQPAACCGVVGLKPTYGRVSRFGLVAFASSLDQIGPLTKDVADAALLMEIISGKDPLDSTSVDLPIPDFRQLLTPDLNGLRIGIPREYFVEGIDGEVDGAVKESLKILEKCGASCKDISLPHTEYAIPAYYVLACAEASSNLARYDGVKYGYRSEKSSNLEEMYRNTRAQGFGAEVKRRIMLGTYVLSAGYYEAYYLKAQKVRRLITGDFEQAFQQCDLIITPTTPAPAFKIGEKINDPLQMYLSDIFTVPANLAGIPALSLPCGVNQEGLPIGLQLMGKHFDEETILRAAFAYEKLSKE